MIEVTLTAEQSTRTPENSCYYRAQAIVDGQTYLARSRRGATNELARLLVDAGIPDAPMQVRQEGFAGHLTVPSFHMAATFTYTEGATTSVRRIPWTDPAFRTYQTGVGEAETEGSMPPGAMTVPLSEQAPGLASHAHG